MAGAAFTAAGVALCSAGVACAALGAVAIVLGSLLLARTLVGSGIQSATGALGGLLLGMVGKWVLVAAVFVLAIGILKLPVLPLLAGLAAAVVASTVAAARTV